MLVTVCFYFLSKRERKSGVFEGVLTEESEFCAICLVYECERRVDCELCVEFLSDDGMFRLGKTKASHGICFVKDFIIPRRNFGSPDLGKAQ